jgi:hypothetical protein
MKRIKFVKNTVLGTMAALIGTEIVFGSSMLAGYEPLALQDTDPFKIFGLDNEKVVLHDNPWNIEAKAHLLDDKITPNKSMFIRNNGILPENIDVSKWTLTIEGESASQKKEK